jgi:hypothetical protein
MCGEWWCGFGGRQRASDLAEDAGMSVQITTSDVDAGSLLAGAQFADAYTLTVEDPALDARGAAERMFNTLPRWISGLMAVRNFVVALFGLKTSTPRKTARDVVGFFPVISQSPDRLVAGFDDKHLDFRVVVDVVPAGEVRRVTTTTLVRRHNLSGRLYLAVVLPFHRIIVPSMMRQLLDQRRE